MPRPLVTALVRTYQCAPTLALAVASVLAQTMDDLECLIVDDGSSDGTEELVASFSDRRIRYLRHAQNRGRAAARKTGLNEARGEYVGLLDADDWWYPRKLERQVQVLRAEPSLPLVSCAMVLFDPSFRPLGVEQVKPGAPPLVRFQPLSAPAPAPVPNPPSLLRTEIARRVNTDLSLPRCEDFDFILPVLLNSPFALLSEVLYAYALPEAIRHRVHAESARSARRVYAKYLLTHPLASLRRQGECLLKEAAYAVSARLGQDGRPLRRRGRPPLEEERKSFEAALSEVKNSLSHLVPTG